VFVDEPAEEIRRISETASLDIVQLHGPPDAARRRQIDLPVWQVVRMDQPAEAVESGSPVDAWLIDSYSARAPGGTGTPVDWQAARRFIDTSSRPVMLAGGLTADNVAEAVRCARPWGVDVSSGVEASPGRKDLTKVKAFIEQCRSC
jgi:phosphoribosylanthranilate isomerase